ncbi:MAG: PulJ/GspJ family protein [Acidimicrobiales bacterium]
MPRPSRSRDDERGSTLMELVVYMGVLSVVLAVFAASLLSAHTVVAKAEGRNSGNDQARQAIQQLDREIRSGATVHAPTAGGMELRVYTEANAPSRGGSRCVQWRVEGGRLQARSWAPDWAVSGDVEGWRTVADDVVNATLSPPVPAFSRPSTATVDIRIITRQSERDGRPAEIAMSLTGRNTRHRTPVAACDGVPA